jgi:hypothetical protein
MFDSFLTAGDGGNYGGPQLLARWYERNGQQARDIRMDEVVYIPRRVWQC